ncbi:MAG: DUF2339 domain-containing protein [Verrucomicrobiaceae bacterium]
MDSLSDRINQAELDLRSLHEEARRLGISLREIKTLAEQQPAEESTPSPAELLTPPPLPSQPETWIEPAIEQPELEKDSPPARKPVKKQSLPAYSGKLELELGRVWFVRLGIVLLTTGLVFLSSYTYKNFIHDLSPGIRLGLLYLVSISLTGIGLFCEQWKPNLRQWGRIVAAGGLASIYYTSFAAHNVAPLKVIESPVTGSILLLATAVLCGAISVWKDSKLLLGTSIALAFYSITLNPLGWMVGIFILLLTIGGSLIAHRKQWPEILHLGLVGSYLTYTISALTSLAFYEETRWFLVAFWALFVVLTFTEKIAGHRLFSSINHTAFFTLFSFNPATWERMDGHWSFCLILGAALIAIGLSARERFPRESVLLHLINGLGLITLGIILKLSGHHLFITLLVESIFLIALALKIKKPLLAFASCAIAGISIIAGFLNQHEVPGEAWGLCGLLWMIFAILHRLNSGEKEAPHLIGLIGFAAATLALVFGAFKEADPGILALTVSLIGLGTTALHWKKIQLRHLTDAYLIAAAASPLALLYLIAASSHSTLLISGLLVSAALSFLHHRQVSSSMGPNLKELHEALHHGLYALSFGFAASAIHHGIPAEALRMLLFLTLPLIGTLIARKTNTPIHATISYFTYLGLLGHFSFESIPLLGGLIILIIHLIILRHFYLLPNRPVLESISFLGAATLWFSWLAWNLSQGSEPFVILSWSGAGILLLDRLYPRTLVTLAAIPFIALGIVGAWLVSGFGNQTFGQVYWGLLPLIIMHLGAVNFRLPHRHTILGTIALLFLWVTISSDVSADRLAVSWALLGTFTLIAGLIFKSRPFRVVALIIIASSLAHIMLVDIIKLDPLPRILSFITLGIGLLGLGFIYNRWQDKLKQIL